MANIKSAKKRIKTNEKRRKRNKMRKTAMKNAIKNFEHEVEEGSYEEALEAYNLAQKRIDKAASKNVIHKNKAARKKSQLTKQLKALERDSKVG